MSKTQNKSLADETNEFSTNKPTDSIHDAVTDLLKTVLQQGDVNLSILFDKWKQSMLNRKE